MATNNPSSIQLSRDNWDRYEYSAQRGHRTYIKQARLNERFYLGGGLQWSDADRAKLNGLMRPVIELNNIWPVINTIVGQQINSRVDVSYQPKKADGDDVSELLTKLAMHILDQNDYQWTETQVYSDGEIQQRGFFDIRIEYDDNLNGEIRLSDLDPLDVIPDIDSNSYDPKRWNDVIVTRWLSLDDIEQLYGRSKRSEIENYTPSDSNWGDDSLGEGRNTFADSSITGSRRDSFDMFRSDGGVKRVRVIDRQYRVLSNQEIAIYPSGDMRPIEEELSDSERQSMMEQGVFISRRQTKRVKWVVSTADVVLHNDWSPYQEFTIVPYFPYFRRGKTRGDVDNLTSPQEMLNKTASQALHIVNTSANSGWVVEEGSLVNMNIEQLEQNGAKTGLVIEYKRGTQPPNKIQPNGVPTGIDRIAEKSEQQIKAISGANDAAQGLPGNEISGVAIQSRHFQNQQQFAMPLDNLARTRHILATRILELIQRFYTEPQVFMITEQDEFGKNQKIPLEVNQVDITGQVLNDLTVGEYDVVIADTPTAATFRDSQFQQALELRKAGVSVPDNVLIQNSTLTRKAEVLEQMAGKPDPSQEAETRKLMADAIFSEAKAINEQAKAESERINRIKIAADAGKTLADGGLAAAAFAEDALDDAELNNSPDTGVIANAERDAAEQPIVEETL